MNVKALVTCLIAASFFAAAKGWATPAKPGGQVPSIARPAAPAKSSLHPSAGTAPTAKNMPRLTTASLIQKPAVIRPRIVAIDAGHGGKDTGAVGPGGTQEKQVTYAIARKLESLVRAKPGMKPAMVRRGDTFISLQRRTELARLAGADLFLSIHADAYADARAKGSSVFVHAPRRVEYARGAKGLSESRRAAGKVLSELRKRHELHYHHVQRASFVVLKTRDMPSMLVETGFISNPEEERKLASPAYQEKIARGIYNGVCAYFQAIRPVDVRTAAVPTGRAVAKRNPA